MFVSLAVLRSVAKTVSHQSLWWETVILTRNCEPDPSWSVSLVSLLFFLFAFFFSFLLLVFMVFCLNCNSEEAITAYKRKGLCVFVCVWVCLSVTERILSGIMVHVLPLRSSFRSVNHSFRLTPHSSLRNDVSTLEHFYHSASIEKKDLLFCLGFFFLKFVFWCDFMPAIPSVCVTHQGVWVTF